GLGVVSRAQLRSQWRTVYMTITVLAAVITPDWSPITMLLVAAAMVGLYELSLVLARWAFPGRELAPVTREEHAREGGSACVRHARGGAAPILPTRYHGEGSCQIRLRTAFCGHRVSEGFQDNDALGRDGSGARSRRCRGGCVAGRNGALSRFARRGDDSSNARRRLRGPHHPGREPVRGGRWAVPAAR